MEGTERTSEATGRTGTLQQPWKSKKERVKTVGELIKLKSSRAIVWTLTWWKRSVQQSNYGPS